MAPNFVRQTVRAMDGYTPGEQPGMSERVVKLNTNENPFLPSPRVLQAIRDIEGESLRRYPNPTADQFREAAAKLHNLKPQNIIAGNGSDDILTIATRTFLPAGGSLAFPDPTYSLYRVLGELQDARGMPIPWGDHYSLPIEGLVATKANAIYVANPNAPTGTMIPPAQIAKLAAAFSGLILVDEAYADFADENCLHLVEDFSNIVIARTLSKAYSLAGLRFGYAVAQPQVIAEMMKVKDSYNCDALSVIAATAAIEDQAYARWTWENIRTERKKLTSELHGMGWSVQPSHANFLWAAPPDGRGKEAYLGLKQQHILVRHFDKPGLADHIRITVGQSHENTALLAGIRALATNEKTPRREPLAMPHRGDERMTVNATAE